MATGDEYAGQPHPPPHGAEHGAEQGCNRHPQQGLLQQQQPDVIETLAIRPIRNARLIMGTDPFSWGKGHGAALVRSVGGWSESVPKWAGVFERGAGIEERGVRTENPFGSSTPHFALPTPNRNAPLCSVAAVPLPVRCDNALRGKGIKRMRTDSVREGRKWEQLARRAKPAGLAKRGSRMGKCRTCGKRAILRFLKTAQSCRMCRSRPVC